MYPNCSIENLQSFVNDLEEGSLEAYVKSESVPESNDGPVVVAVAKNFEDVVTNNDKDVLIGKHILIIIKMKKVILIIVLI